MCKSDNRQQRTLVVLYPGRRGLCISDMDVQE